MKEISGPATYVPNVKATSKYEPHEGKREKARRRRQIERGVLKP